MNPDVATFGCSERGAQMRKICVVITARPSYARIKTVLEAINKHPELELQLVVGASALLERYGPAIKIIRQDGFEPDAVVHMVVEGENLVTTAKSTGQIGRAHLKVNEGK